MARAVTVIFTELSANDFFKINSTNLASGGGQSYIDFPTSFVRLPDWEAFFHGHTSAVSSAGWRYWTFPIHNLGVRTVQQGVELGQRRNQSFNIRSQKLPEISQQGRRLDAWHPKNGFPALSAMATEAGEVELPAGLRVFLIRDDAGDIWAGWSQGGPPQSAIGGQLARLFTEEAGVIHLAGQYEIDPNDVNWPFRGSTEASPSLLPPSSVSVSASGNEATGLEVPVPTSRVAPERDQDIRPDSSTRDGAEPRGLEVWDPADEIGDGEAFGYKTQKVRERNRAAVTALKGLYKACQITGDEYVFETLKGSPYLEVHHLVALGLGGADQVHNMIVVSAHVHRLLHHAKVEGLDLTKIADGKLPIRINGEPHTITWHPQHAAIVAGNAGAVAA